MKVGIKTKTCRLFMAKYNLNVMQKNEKGFYRYKSMKSMQDEIYKYESRHNRIGNGMYFEGTDYFEVD